MSLKFTFFFLTLKFHLKIYQALLFSHFQEARIHFTTLLFVKSVSLSIQGHKLNQKKTGIFLVYRKQLIVLWIEWIGGREVEGGNEEAKMERQRKVWGGSEGNIVEKKGWGFGRVYKAEWRGHNEGVQELRREWGKNIIEGISTEGERGKKG